MSEHMNSQNPQRGGRHRLDDDVDEYGYVPPSHPTDEYSEVRYGSADDYPEVETQYAAAQAAEADYSEAAIEDDSDDDNPSATGAAGTGNGKSLRALAIVCVLIALLLVAYGIYAFVKGEDDKGVEGDAATQTSSQAAPAPTAPNGQAQPAQPSQPGQPGQPSQPAPEGQPSAVPPAAPKDPNAAAPAPAPSDAPAPGAPAPIDRAAFPVTVLNNTTEQSLAATTSTTLSDEGWRRGEVGNIPENEARLEKTTVYFAPDNPAEKAAAEQIAKDHGWVAAPRDALLDGKPGGIVVVLAGGDA